MSETFSPITVKLNTLDDGEKFKFRKELTEDVWVIYDNRTKIKSDTWGNGSLWFDTYKSYDVRPSSENKVIVVE